MSVKALSAAVIAAAVGVGEVGIGTMAAHAAPLAMDRSVASVPAAIPASFWGRPYPYGYAYRRPRDECHVVRRVRGRHGWHWRRVYICGSSGVVTSRY